MLKKHSNILNNNLNELVLNTNLDRLVPELISINVFTQEMVDRIWRGHDSDPRLRAISLYLEVIKRGPNAFSGLVHALMKSGHRTLGEKLLQSDALDLHLPVNNGAIVNLPTTIDSPDSSPTHHHCRISHAQPFQLPEYMDQSLRNVFRQGHPAPDDIVNLCEGNTATRVFVRHASQLHQSDGSLPEKYRMTSKPRGYALIINNLTFDDQDDYPTRNGADNDDVAIKSLLQQFYFQVEDYRNKNKQDMVQIVEEFARKSDWHTMDCACVVLMSHGREGDSEEDTEIVSTDGLGYKTRDILSLFYNDACPQLLNKPKIFIFHSCRGILTDQGVVVDLYNVPPMNHRTETDGRMRSRKAIRDRSQSDMFIAYPVPPGMKANRDRFTGAWFIQTIVDVFAEYAYNCDIEDLFKIVDYRLKKMINLWDPNFQTVTTKTIGWSKKLFFNPGLCYFNDRVVRERPDLDDSGMDVVDTPAECQLGNKSRKEDKMQLTSKDDDHDNTGCFRCRPS